MSISTATVEEHARKTIGQRLQRVHDEISATIENPAVDPVHDLRVSIRRASQALRLFSGLLPPKEPRKMRHALKAALDAAGRTRDLDVGAELLQKEDLAEQHAMYSVLAAERQKAALALVGRLYLLRSKEVPLVWLPMLDRITPDDRPATDAAREALPPIAREFFVAGRKTMSRTPGPEKLHALRLAAKRFRYTLELWEPFYGPAFKAKLERVREIQSILGKRQDCAVMVERLAPLSPLDQNLQEAQQRLEARGTRLEREFHEFWHALFDAPGQEEAWIRYLARHSAVRRTPPGTST